MGMETIHGDVIRVTDNAFLFTINGDPDDTIWVPLSVVEDGDATEPDDDVDLLIASWWYRQHEKRFD